MTHFLIIYTLNGIEKNLLVHSSHEEGPGSDKPLLSLDSVYKVNPSEL
jgi:hypothetical protein